jgi:hypothetical protein
LQKNVGRRKLKTVMTLSGVQGKKNKKNGLSKYYLVAELQPTILYGHIYDFVTQYRVLASEGQQRYRYIYTKTNKKL